MTTPRKRTRARKDTPRPEGGERHDAPRLEGSQPDLTNYPIIKSLSIVRSESDGLWRLATIHTQGPHVIEVELTPDAGDNRHSVFEDYFKVQAARLFLSK